MNVRDSEVIAGLLSADGLQLTDNPEEAKVIIFNTCSVRQHAEDKVWSQIGRYGKAYRVGRSSSRKAEKPIIGIVGCMAQNYKEKIFERVPEVDFVVGPQDIAKIPQILKKLLLDHDTILERKIFETDGLIRPEYIYHSGFYQDKEHAYVVISEGCSNFCSYCVVPYVRGPLRNRKTKDIIKEIRSATDKGITKFTLLGQNVNAFIEDSKNFVDLLRMVNSISGIKEFSFVTSHPKDTNESLFKIMSECEKLKKYLHLPLQSGSDRILKLMNRGYTAKDYLGLIEKYRKIVKDGKLTTDIIVGFPGETEDDFRKTYNLVEKIRFNAAYIFKYSARPQTKASLLEDDVSTEEKKRRHQMVLDLQRKISRQK